MGPKVPAERPMGPHIQKIDYKPSKRYDYTFFLYRSIYPSPDPATVSESVLNALWLAKPGRCRKRSGERDKAAQRAPRRTQKNTPIVANRRHPSCNLYGPKGAPSGARQGGPEGTKTRPENHADNCQPEGLRLSQKSRGPFRLPKLQAPPFKSGAPLQIARKSQESPGGPSD